MPRKLHLWNGGSLVWTMNKPLREWESWECTPEPWLSIPSKAPLIQSKKGREPGTLQVSWEGCYTQLQNSKTWDQESHRENSMCCLHITSTFPKLLQHPLPFNWGRGGWQQKQNWRTAETPWSGHTGFGKGSHLALEQYFPYLTHGSDTREEKKFKRRQQKLYILPAEL